MDFKDYILFLVSAVDIVMCLIIFVHNPRSAVNVAFSLTALWAALWGFGLAMFRLSSDFSSQLFWNREFILTAALIGSSFLHFSFVFGKNDTLKLNWKKLFLIYCPNIIIFLTVITPGVLIKDILVRDWGNESILGWGYIYYGIYFTALWLWASINLLRKYKRGDQFLKTQIKYIYIGVGISIIFGATFNLVFILLGNYRYVWLGPYAMFGFIVATSYAIIKHQLLNIKVITTEIFAVSLSFVSFTELLRSKDTIEFVSRFSLFISTLIFAALLIHSVLREVKRREEMEVLTKKLRKTSKKLAAANKELERLDEAKSEFLSIASHQLRTPLTTVKGYTSMMLEGSFGKLSKIMRDGLQKVYISGERLISLVDDLLNISRIEAGRLEFNILPVDLAKIAEETVSDFQQKVKEKKIKLEFYPEPNLPPVATDPQKIKEVISNIIDNSVKYTMKGEIIVGLHQESRSIVFSCQDTGIGIDPEDLPRLFEKFVRGKGMMQVYTEGTGLGLYFARMVIENMGGRIWAESEGKNKGSKFSFSLPLADKGQAKKVG